MNKLGDDIMAKFDKLIGEFGNTPAILQAAHEDLAADNQAAAAEDYGRGVSLHESCDYREAALKEQIERLIVRGIFLADYTDCLNLASINWYDEVKRARELMK